MTTTIALTVIASSLLLFGYTYFGYPALLRLMGLGKATPGKTPGDWPTVSISVPAYNEEAQIEELIKSLLALDYPRSCGSRSAEERRRRRTPLPSTSPGRSSSTPTRALSLA